MDEMFVKSGRAAVSSGAGGEAGNERGGLRRGVGREEVAAAAQTLARYKQGKENLEQRIVQDELWWELRHWEAIGKDARHEQVRPTSAWLFNAILNKHADAMDNFPEPVVLPRERSDEESAATLSEVLPVILENCGYEQTYADNWWEKLKHGTAAYGVFWNSERENGLGDVDIRRIDLLKLFWEPGVTDIQDSRSLFIVELADEDALERQYPEHRGRLRGNAVDVKQYVYDESIDLSGKSVVVDWYYKLRGEGGSTVLHYAKFVGQELLYASENDPRYADRGFYDHGLYPVVLDVLFPEKGTPCGFGYVAVCRDPQLYIDRLSGNILECSMMNTKKRFFASTNTNINREQFLDWNEPIVDVEGELDDRRLREIVCQPLDGIYVNVVQMKIEEMKDTAGNRDVNSGGTGSGVTAASAIAALQEAGNKTSRDMISGSYRAHTRIASLCIELIRQFYDEQRTFRITGAGSGEYSFVQLGGAQLREQPAGPSAEGGLLYRRPVFDLKVRAQKKNPFSRMEQNERAKELYGLGFFNPERAQEALAALEMMDFEGIDKVREQARQGQTLLRRCQELTMKLEQCTQTIAALTGAAPAQGAAPEPEAQGNGRASSGRGAAARAVDAHRPREGYAQALARRSVPDMEAGNDAR